jgi:hypothetical protein
MPTPARASTGSFAKDSPQRDAFFSGRFANGHRVRLAFPPAYL